MHTTVTIDVGTTGVKFCLFDAAGSVQTSARHPTPTRKDAAGETYDLPVLTRYLSSFMAELTPDQRAGVERIAITAVGESGGLVRPDLSLASPMILWHDHRGAARIQRLSEADRTALYATTGLPANANYGISKVSWALEQAIRSPADTSIAGSTSSTDGAQWLNIAEYLAALISGQRWSEYSLASRTMALDLRQRTWSPAVCDLFEVPAEVFPPLRAATEGAPISAAYAGRHDLSSQVQVHVAGHDHMVGAAGADLAPGELLNSTGTTEGLLFLRPAPALDGAAQATKLANGISCDGAQYTLFASIPTGGSAFATLQHLMSMDEARLGAVVTDVHRRYLDGHVDLDRIPVVLPQFRGSPPPTKQASARGVIAGLSTDTTAEELVFGVFLGMDAQFADVLELFGQQPERIKVIGPASRNPLWLQTKADLLGLPLSVSSFPEVVSRGAALLASAQRGDWAQCTPREVTPDAARHTQLRRWREQTKAQWNHLAAMPH